MKKIVISGFYGSDNAGDEAILASMLATIKEVVSDADIIVLSGNVEQTTKRHNIKALSNSTMKIPKTLSTLKNADLFILGGGGLLQDDSSILNLIFWLIRVSLAKLLNKCVMCYAIGVGPIDTKLGKFLTKLIINKVNLITVRDSESKKLLKNLGVNRPPIYVTADPAFVLSSATPERVSEIFARENIIKKHHCPLIGISVERLYGFKRVLPVKYSVKYNIWSPGGKSKFEKFKAEMAQVADSLVTKLNAEIVFVPMYHGRDDKVSADIVQIMKNKNHAKVVTGMYTPQELKGIIGQMDMFVGLRLHSLIFAASMCIPMVGLAASSPKIRSFLKLIGQEMYVCDVNDFNSNDLLIKIEEVWVNREQIRKKLKSKVNVLQKRALSNAKLVSELLKD